MDNWPEFIKKHFATVPFFRFLDVTVNHTARGEARLSLKLRPEYANTYGITHGGVVAALVDMAAGVAARTLKVRVVTVENAVNYFLPVTPAGELVAEARVLHEGSKLIHAEVRVVNYENILVAGGRCIFYVTGEDTGNY
jgi:uncharacterized protein (TIGR00369 family)